MVAGFVERHGLWGAEHQEAARRMLAQIDEQGLETVRLGFADQHGIVRGKTLVAQAVPGVLKSGLGAVGTLLLKDSSHRTAWPVFERGGGLDVPGFAGASDIMLVADPTTFKVLPWSPRSGWVQCDAYFPDGRPVPFDSRGVLRRALAQLQQRGLRYVTGLEVEFYLFRITDPRLALADGGWPGTPPDVALLESGYQLLTEQRYDQVEPALEILRRTVQALELPLRSMEVELGPSQLEMVFDPGEGLASADRMILFRNAAKQVMRRHGYHVSFMCRPTIPNVMSSGWHLHQSLCDAHGRNVFAVDAAAGASAGGAPAATGAGKGAGDVGPLSPLGRAFLAGLLAHARGNTVFAAPTINAYRRYRPNSLAPDRASWGCDNRGAMLRVMGGAGDPATRIENRVGEPAANPYLYLASQIFAGLDGVDRGLDPGPSADLPYQSDAPALPRSLGEALAALQADATLREAFGATFVDYYLHVKRSELARFEGEVTEWEQREYFDLF